MILTTSIISLLLCSSYAWNSPLTKSLRANSSPHHHTLVVRWATENDRENATPSSSSSQPIKDEAEATTKSEQEQPSSSARPPPVTRQQPTLSTRDMMVAMGTSPRRIFLASLSASGIALTGNLFGVTSQLLAALPEDQVAATGLDTYFPRGPYKRYRTVDYSLVIPKEWVADTALELAKAQQRSKSLDYSLRGPSTKSTTILPDAAFGPPGNLLNDKSTSGDTNVSVIRTPAPANFDLRQVMTTKSSQDGSSEENDGDATVGAQFLLQNFLAGKGREVSLLSVDANNSAASPTTRSTSYRFSYRVDRGETRAPLQAVSIIAQKFASTPTVGSTLFTFTVVAPVGTWESSFRTKLYKVADSFVLS
eukprot:scaffold43901_cov183-Amphora_coffeaeformis.AAC.2